MDDEQLVQKLIDQTRSGRIDWRRDAPSLSDIGSGSDGYSATLADGARISVCYRSGYTVTESWSEMWWLHIWSPAGEDNIYDEVLVQPLLDAVTEFKNREDSARRDCVRRKLYDDLG